MSKLPQTGLTKRGSSNTTPSPTTSETSKVNSLPSRKSPRWRRLLRRHSRAIVENKPFIAFGTIVTLWALAGDDLRLACTDQPADKYFDGIVIFNILFFSFEIIVSCLGKDDYFPGFFFGLDVISTATLFLDLSQVSEAMFGDSSSDGSDNARTGRTARVGAKIGRVVRVLRLIRIVKLYKALTTSNTERRISEEDPPDWSETDGEEQEEEVRSPGKESLVGKKLSAKTTQRTIILVLTLLIALPTLSTSSLQQLPPSGQFGADEVSDAFVNLVEEGTNETAILDQEVYEDIILRYLFYHNWFQGRRECPQLDYGCSSWYFSHVFWVGITGRSEDLVTARAGRAQISQQKVAAWNSQAATQDELYNYGTMPQDVLNILSSSWTTRCRHRGTTHLGLSVLSREIEGQVSHTVECPEALRSMEREAYAPRLMSREAYNRWHFVFYFDLRPYTRQEAALNIITTVFICVVLCVASLFFSSDANNLVLTPVEQMIKKVEAIRDNPLKATEMADEAFNREEKQRSKEEQKDRMPAAKDLWRRVFCCKRKQKKRELLETMILEKTIIKLGSLLALGFGEAGANIVSHNMRGSNTSGVNAMVSGERVECIVGNVRIRDFSTATEVLQEKIMQFVNQIAEIVHGVVDEFHGAANKNNGDIFLIIWRTGEVPKKKVSRMADMSVFAFAKILGGVHRSNVLAAYRYHPGLQQRLGSDCRVNLSLGLHCGWAIEGAVGSEFKIDASYLSPNISIASCIELATRVYSVSLLISQAVVEQCEKAMVSNLRLIDRVRFVGTKNPIDLYCLDLDHLSLQVDEPLRWVPVWNLQMRHRSRQYLLQKKRAVWVDETPISSLFEEDSLVSTMRSSFSQVFWHQFNMGYQNYAQGEWLVARSLLSKTLAMLRRQDGPSLALLRYMGTFQFQAPPSWAGVRDLGNLHAQ